jgi:hypothetical protein
MLTFQPTTHCQALDGMILKKTVDKLLFFLGELKITQLLEVKKLASSIECLTNLHAGHHYMKPHKREAETFHSSVPDCQAKTHQGPHHSNKYCSEPLWHPAPQHPDQYSMVDQSLVQGHGFQS